MLSSTGTPLSTAVIVDSREVVEVASIVVRGLDESVKSQLVAQAKQHGRSVEAELREILTRSAAEETDTPTKLAVLGHDDVIRIRHSIEDRCGVLVEVALGHRTQ